MNRSNKIRNTPSIGDQPYYFLRSVSLAIIFLFGIAFNTRSLSELRSSLPDIGLTAPEIVKRHGYPIEVHNVTTEDGYILGLHRLPRPGSPVVFVTHGIICTSVVWVEAGPNFSLAYSFYNNGFDVWLGNARGNEYSKQHKIYSNESTNQKFWNFSWHEMGLYDLPASIDYILNTTGQSKINYIGHSLGATTFLVLMSQRPEYNAKIRQMHALAPAVFMTESFSSPQLFLRILKTISWTQFVLSREFEAATNSRFFHLIGINTRNGGLMRTGAESIYSNMFGVSIGQVNMDLAPVFLSHSPAGACYKNVIHLSQLFNTDKFSMYDFGNAKLNKMKYGSVKPPEYNISKVTVPIYLHVGSTDTIARVKDAETLKKRLPNVKGFYIVDNVNFNHMDFLWGKQTKQLVWEKIINLMKQD